MSCEESFYKSLFGKLHLGIACHDQRGNLIELNAAAEEILGISIAEGDQHKDIYEALKPLGANGSEIIKDNYPHLQVLGTRQCVTNMVMGLFCKKTLEYKWWLVNADIQKKDDSGKSCYVYTTFSDISNIIQNTKTVNVLKASLDFSTNPVNIFAPVGNILYQNKSYINIFISDLRKAEKALLDSEKRFRLMIENSNDAITLIGSDGSVIYASPSVPKITGYTVEERLGKSGFENIHPDDLPRLKNIVNELVNEYGKTVATEFRAVRKDGTIWWSEGSATNLLNVPGINALIINYRDVTDRKNAEDAFISSEKRFRSMIENSSDVITLLDVNGKVTYVTPSIYAATGYTVEERIGKDGFDLIHPDESKKSMLIIAELIKKPGDKISGQFKTVKKDGTVWWAEGSAINLLNDPNINAIVINSRDISDRKKAEDEIQRQNVEYQLLNDKYLEQNEKLLHSLTKIKKINEELKKAKVKAEESDRLKTVFLANMSHEIRTPMNGILGFAELLRQPELTNDLQSKYVEVIQRSGNRMLNIINDLIDISKIEAGQMEVYPEDTNIGKVLDEVYLFFKPEANDRQIDLSYSKNFPPNLMIKTDITRLNQILSNLVKNALKFTKKGCIEFGCHVKNNILEFFVRDTGMGIAPELQNRIFDRFIQGDISLSRPYEGTGLGLSISKAFIEMLGGRIWLKSEPGKGSVFYFTLPVTEVEPHPEKAQTISDFESDAFKNSLILVVEDDDYSYLLIKEMLEKKGIKTIRAADGNEAVDKIQKISGINLVLMDIKMPNMNGLDATRLVKQLRPDLPVIAQTAYASEEHRQQFLLAGCDDYIAKPIDRILLLEKLDRFFN